MKNLDHILKMKDTIIPGWITKRIKNNKNCIGIINGATGSGKTYACLDLASTLAKMNNSSFIVKDNVDFSFLGLKKKMNLPQNQGKGTVFLFEEVGAIGGGAASRQWQSKANAFFFSFMQTARHKNQILLMTCPQFNYLDKGVRQMCHIQITMLNINSKTKKSIGKPFIIQTNPMSGKMYFKYLRYNEDGKRRVKHRLMFDLPPQNMVQDYEKMKNEFTKQLDKKILEKDGGVKGKPDIRMAYDIIMDERMKQKGMSVMERAKVFGISRSTYFDKARDEKSMNESVNQNNTPHSPRENEVLKGTKGI